MKSLIKIFILEDDVFYANSIKTMLSKDDRFELTIFHNPVDFLKNIHLLPDIVTLDYNMEGLNGVDVLKRIKQLSPQTHPIIISGQQDVSVVVKLYDLGVKEYLPKDQHTFIKLQQSIKSIVEQISSSRELEVLKERLIEREKYTKIIGESPAVLKLLRLIQKVEKTDYQVLINGESGTGKELVAEAIHYHSNRKKKPFVKVNMAAIPEELLESELFGHEKGAFTGADSRRIGRFEEADEGTIFLDEIGELDFTLQPKLLRVLQEQVVQRLGGNREIELNVRVIAATNKDLPKLVEQGKFREDLYYRLQGFMITIPPLRERENDVLILANHFLKDFLRKQLEDEKVFSKEAKAKLLSHTWPGNIRELKTAVERSVLMSEGKEISDEDVFFN
ncbi:MAG: sigma-54-dependent Fis family transcriptional regulator [Chitinophagaceae bacterium]|nr:MAG: sigma-54-dependent Fis family transcriptional regulator [Chitinophagaceae bacterium]